MRLNAAERKVFRERYAAEREENRRKGRRHAPVYSAIEPALGTLEERLDIIIRRLGGTTGPVRLTERERREFAEYLKPTTEES